MFFKVPKASTLLKIFSPNYKMLRVSLRQKGKDIEADVTLDAPVGWKVKPIKDAIEPKRFLVYAPKVQNLNIIKVCISLDNRYSEKEFVILGPNIVKGYSSGENVPTCPNCHAWIHACICKEKKY